jgi:tRNA A37 methylthiotransferase MiaB
LDVLVESESGPYRYLRGFADNYVEVRLPGDASLRGEIVRVEITEADGGVCTGVGS